MIEFLCAIGFFALAAVVIIAICITFEELTDKIEAFKWKYKREHRFDKPPTAKCYCKDCIYYRQRNEYGKCENDQINKLWYKEDSWFCKDASPRSVDPDKEKRV